MAEGGFFSRVANLWRGFLSIWISGVEQKHPEIAYENAINSMVVKYTQLKKATAAIIRRREDVTARLEKARIEIKQVDKDLATAVNTDQRDLGVVLIQKQNSLNTEIAELEGEL